MSRHVLFHPPQEGSGGSSLKHETGRAGLTWHRGLRGKESLIPKISPSLDMKRKAKLMSCNHILSSHFPRKLEEPHPVVVLASQSVVPGPAAALRRSTLEMHVLGPPQAC